MVMGRPTKPNELKRRIGTDRPDRERKPLAVLPSTTEVPKAPTGLKRQGKAAWGRYWSLGSAWLSPTTDLEIVTRLCQAYDEREQLRAEVKKYGHVVARVVGEADLGTGDGPTRVYEMKPNPAVGQLRKVEELITRYEGLCGFTPSDRSRLGMAEIQRESKLEQFLSRRGGRAAES